MEGRRRRGHGRVGCASQGGFGEAEKALGLQQPLPATRRRRPSPDPSCLGRAARASRWRGAPAARSGTSGTSQAAWGVRAAPGREPQREQRVVEKAV